MEIKFNSADLIFDRTQADVDYALALERASMHADENLRGAYNSSDRNRVAAALNALTDILRNRGYDYFDRLKSDWKEGEIVKASDNAATLRNLREAWRFLPHTSLELPDTLDYLSWQKANAVERILFDMFEVYDMTSDTWLWCGEGYAGYDFEEHRLDDYWV